METVRARGQVTPSKDSKLRLIHMVGNRSHKRSDITKSKFIQEEIGDWWAEGLAAGLTP